MKNPFNPQDPPAPEYFYGRTQVRDRFKENIDYGLEGHVEHMALTGDWGIGKTSLLRKLHSIDTSKEIKTIYIPLNPSDVESFTDFANCVVTQIGKELNKLDLGFELDKISLKFLEIQKKESENKVMEFTDDMEKLYDECGGNGSLVILFLDDLHLAAHHRDEIRNCFQELNRRECNYMVVGTLIPELFEDGEINSPFKRMFKEHSLSEFSKKESRDMINHIVNEADMDVELSDSLYDKLYEETDGHPHYLTLFMHELVREKDQGKLTMTHYKNREPVIMESVKVNLDNKFNNLTEKDREILQKLVKLDEKEFSPKDIDSESSKFKQLEKKGVLTNIGWGRYKFKFPIIGRYFAYKYEELFRR